MFIYEEETRKHTLNGKHIGSVSQIIAPLNDFSKIPPGKLERKRQLGIEFHEAIRLHLLDDLAFDDLDPDLVNPMNTFVKWWKVEGDGIHDADMIIEEPVCHQTLKFCGKPDLELETKLFDFKLRKYNRITDTLQLIAYQHLVSRKNLSLWTICFDLEGKMSIYVSYHPKSWGIFRRMLERYNSELEFNNLMENWKGVN